ncbi:hypothetical protein TWF506_004060 [Arthrobotrys conoides]|uniref:Uncharacterized protein n=1 Tax=Arthrobotrys conoides TaxID=74498 RepID=A0AAN8RPN0_9PEZI
MDYRNQKYVSHIHNLNWPNAHNSSGDSGRTLQPVDQAYQTVQAVVARSQARPEAPVDDPGFYKPIVSLREIELRSSNYANDTFSVHGGCLDQAFNTAPDVGVVSFHTGPHQRKSITSAHLPRALAISIPGTKGYFNVEHDPWHASAEPRLDLSLPPGVVPATNYIESDNAINTIPEQMLRSNSNISASTTEDTWNSRNFDHPPASSPPSVQNADPFGDRPPTPQSTSANTPRQPSAIAGAKAPKAIYSCEHYPRASGISRTECANGFTNLRKFETHLQTDHKIPKYLKCPNSIHKCPHKNNRMDNLKVHLKTCKFEPKAGAENPTAAANISRPTSAPSFNNAPDSSQQSAALKHQRVAGSSGVFPTAPPTPMDLQSPPTIDSSLPLPHTSLQDTSAVNDMEIMGSLPSQNDSSSLPERLADVDPNPLEGVVSSKADDNAADVSNGQENQPEDEQAQIKILQDENRELRDKNLVSYTLISTICA